MKKLILVFIAATLVLFLAACSTDQESLSSNELNGIVKVDGSSTVFPITEAVAEEFQILNNEVQVTVGVSGTGGGMKKFTIGETDISNASRLIKEKEAVAAKENDIEFIELPVAYDGISVVVNKKNDWVDYLTTNELKMIWEPNSQINKWSQVRDGWPDEEIKLYGPGTASGTFDYFTEELIGESGASRSDFTASEDDNVLIRGVTGDKYSLGYFGYAYYAENQDNMNIVPIDSGKGPVIPSIETINKGIYAPLSRPLFIYVSTNSLKRPEVYEFVKFYINEADVLAAEVGYVALPEAMYNDSLELIESYK